MIIGFISVCEEVSSTAYPKLLTLHSSPLIRTVRATLACLMSFINCLAVVMSMQLSSSQTVNRSRVDCRKSLLSSMFCADMVAVCL